MGQFGINVPISDGFCPGMSSSLPITSHQDPLPLNPISISHGVNKTIFMVPAHSPPPPQLNGGLNNARGKDSDWKNPQTHRFHSTHFEFPTFQ